MYRKFLSVSRARALKAVVLSCFCFGIVFYGSLSRGYAASDTVVAAKASAADVAAGGTASGSEKAGARQSFVNGASSTSRFIDRKLSGIVKRLSIPGLTVKKLLLLADFMEPGYSRA